MTTWGLQQDVLRNPGKNVQLFIPGKTKMVVGDVFLGGEGTGVSDDQIGQAQRIYGTTADDTAAAYTNYQKGQDSTANDTAAQMRAVIAANSAPRVDADRGMPTLARQNMEAGQVQNAITNAFNDKQFNQNTAQKQWENGITRADLMGSFEGEKTLAQKAQEIQDAQYKAGLAQDESQFSRNLGQDESQFGRTLGYNYSNSAANRAIDQQMANYNTGVSTGGSVSGGSMPSEYSSWVNDAATKNGIPPAILAGLLEAESSWNPKIVNPTSGATGLGQFLKTTADDEGLGDRTDAQSSIYAAAAYLAKRVEWAGGDLEKGIMGYGEGTPEYLNRVLSKANNYTVTSGSKVAPTKESSITGTDTKIAQNQAIAIVDSMDAQGKGEGEILSYFRNNASILAEKGVDLTDIRDYISNRRYPGYEPK